MTCAIIRKFEIFNEMEVDLVTKDLFSLKNRESVSLAIIEKLSTNGVTTIAGYNTQDAYKFREKKRKKHSSAVFGLSLEDDNQDRRVTDIRGKPCYLPKFFVVAIEFLKNHVKIEGLFRKAGSLARQKKLRVHLENGCDIPDSADPHDVASMFKQYLREMPIPLLTQSLGPVMLECVSLFSHNSLLPISEAVLLCCLLLPTQHLLCLQALMSLLNKVAVHFDDSLMDSNSLSVVMVPNIFPQSEKRGKKFANIGADIKRITLIVSILIENSSQIGQVPVDIQKLSNEIQETKEQQKLKKKRQQHQRRDSVTYLLRGTLSKIRKTRKEQGTCNTASGDNLLSSPDVFGPSHKRMALNDSYTNKSAPSSCENSPSFFSTRKTFKSRPKLHSGLFYKGNKSVEEKLLLLPRRPLHLTLDTFATPSSSSQLPSQTNLDLLSISPLKNTTNTCTDTVATTTVTTDSTDTLATTTTITTDSTADATATDSTSTATAITGIQQAETDNEGSIFKLVSRTKKLYSYPELPKKDENSLVVRKLFDKKDHSDDDVNMKRSNQVRKRKKSQSKDEIFYKLKDNFLSTSKSEFALSKGCSTVTASTPISKRPKMKRRKTDSCCIEGRSHKDKSFKNVANNKSYLRAVQDSDEDQEESTKTQKILREVGNSTAAISNNHGPSSSTSVVKRTYSVSENTSAYAPSLWGMKEDNVVSNGRSDKLSKRAKRYIVDDGKSVNTAMSPWVNRKDIQISEWII
jgi:hypothetical protein